MRSRAGKLGFSLALLVISSAAAWGQSARIPPTHGTSLAGTSITLPDDLRGRVGVLVLGFSKSSRDVCKGWEQRLAENYRDSREVTYYQVPVLESVPKLIRGMVLKAMKSGVPETEQTHFLPVFSDEATWQKIAHYGNADDAYLVVVDGDGKVLWQTSGRSTDAGFAALKQHIAAARSQMQSSEKK